MAEMAVLIVTLLASVAASILGLIVVRRRVSLETLEQLGDARRDRMTYMRTGIPGFIWTFLLVLGAATIAFTYFFGMSRLLPQTIITGVLAAAISWALVLIHETQMPFSGTVRVPDRAFHVVLRFMEENPSSKGQGSLSVE